MAINWYPTEGPHKLRHAADAASHPGCQVETWLDSVGDSCVAALVWYNHTYQRLLASKPLRQMHPTLSTRKPCCAHGKAPTPHSTSSPPHNSHSQIPRTSCQGLRETHPVDGPLKATKLHSCCLSPLPLCSTRSKQATTAPWWP
jgi:hypothetical protein